MSTARDNTRFAETLAHGLAAAGVEHVVTAPGSRNTPMVLALDRADGIAVHTILDERVAGFVGLGIARHSRAPVALLCTSGTAAAHFFPAVIEANQSRVPLVVMTADRPGRLVDSGSPQTIDQQHLFGRHVRWFADAGAPPSAARARALAARAVHLARTQGPVHLNLPFEEPLWEAGTGAAIAPRSPVRVVVSHATPSDPDVDALARRLRSCQRGVIVCGPVGPSATARPDDLGAAVTRLAGRLGWPVLAEPASQLRYGEHDLTGVITTYDALLRDEGVGAALAPDLVVRIGQTPTSKALGAWLERHGRDQVILIDRHGDWFDPAFVADTLVAADPTDLCEVLADRLPRTDQRRYLRTWLDADAAATGTLDGACADGFWEGGIARALVRNLPDHATLHLASSMPIRDVDGFSPAMARSIRVHANRGANGIDGLVATAIGEAMVSEGPTFLLCGDLALLHDQGALHVAVSLGVELTLVVINNAGGRIFEHLPIGAHPSALARFVTPQGVDISALARAAGMKTRIVRSTAELEAALAGGGFIEAVVEPEDNLKRHHDAWRAIAQIARGRLTEEAA